ncbi:MAG: hypothetical protein AAFY21_18105 [Cyanobacteria bacterium J06641_2]
MKYFSLGIRDLIWYERTALAAIAEFETARRKERQRQGIEYTFKSSPNYGLFLKVRWTL